MLAGESSMDAVISTERPAVVNHSLLIIDIDCIDGKLRADCAKLCAKSGIINSLIQGAALDGVAVRLPVNRYYMLLVLEYAEHNEIKHDVDLTDLIVLLKFACTYNMKDLTSYMNDCMNFYAGQLPQALAMLEHEFPANVKGVAMMTVVTAIAQAPSKKLFAGIDISAISAETAHKIFKYVLIARGASL